MLCFGSGGVSDWGYIFYGSRNSLYQAASFTPLWFLPCFFVSTILFRAIYNFENIWLTRALCLLVGIIGFSISFFPIDIPYGLPFNLNVASVGTLLMGLGYEIKKADNTVLFSNLGGILIIIGSLLAFVNLPDSLTPGNPHVEMSIGEYGNPFLFTLTALSLCISIFMISKIWANYRSSKYVAFIGENSMAYLCIHGFTNIIVIRVLSKFWIVSPILVCFFSICICTITTIIINNNCPNIVGKDKIR